MSYCHEESFWVPGYGISRPVLTSNICFFLGPQAFVRPYTHEGRDGFLITAPGGRILTREQLDDLCNMSKRWEAEASASTCSDPSQRYINRPVPIRRDHRNRR